MLFLGPAMPVQQSVCFYELGPFFIVFTITVGKKGYTLKSCYYDSYTDKRAVVRLAGLAPSYSTKEVLQHIAGWNGT